MSVKRCTVCLEVKPYANFSRQSSSKDGMQFKCKDCDKAYRIKNKDSVALSVKLSWDKSRDKYNKKSRDSKKSSVWKKNNPIRHRAHESARRARKREVSGGYTELEIKNLRAMQSGCCAVCKCKLRQFHIDHIVPLFLRGSNSIENIQLLCPPCNLRKGKKDPLSFMQSAGFLI